jgi:hypothetical protein
MGPDTLEKCERRLRRQLLEIKRIRLRAKRKQSAGMEWEVESGRILVLWVDVYNCGLIVAVVHELIHYCERERLAGRGQLEEGDVLGTERVVWKRIRKSRRRWWWWRRAIAARLVKGDL